VTRKLAPSSLSTDGACTEKAPAAARPSRGRNDRMDALLRAVNGSSRYAVTEIEEQAAKALARRKK